jgi:hypothetical protein
VAVWLRVPDLPVMVTVDGPGVAEADTASVTRRLACVGPAPNEPTTPVGRPDRLTVTVPANPFCGIRVRVLLREAPTGMLRAAGEADSVNVGGGVMVRAMATLLVRLPEVPVMVTVELPGATIGAASKVSVLRLAVLEGAKVAVTPLGRPEAASATVPPKPF